MNVYKPRPTSPLKGEETPVDNLKISLSLRLIFDS